MQMELTTTKSEKITTMQVRETTTGYCSLRPDGILVFKYRDQVVDTRETASENIQTFRRYFPEAVPGPLLILFGKVANLRPGARSHYAKSEEASITATRVALLIDSHVSRVIGNIFMGLDRPEVLTRLFTNEEKAIKWLLTS
jgi:hypothetical protein